MSITELGGVIYRGHIADGSKVSASDVIEVIATHEVNGFAMWYRVKRPSPYAGAPYWASYDFIRWYSERDKAIESTVRAALELRKRLTAEEPHDH